MRNKKFGVWIEGTIIAALAIVLSLIPTNIGPSFTVSLGMVPLTLYAFRRGFVPAVYAGFLWGILHFVIGNAYILSPLQGFIEYFIAFAFAGFGGLFAAKIHSLSQTDQTVKLNLYIVLGTFSGTMARFFWHFVAGYYFWGSYAPEGMSALLYSFVTQILSGVITAVVVSILLIAIKKTAPQLFSSTTL